MLDIPLFLLTLYPVAELFPVLCACVYSICYWSDWYLEQAVNYIGMGLMGNINMCEWEIPSA